MMVMVSMNGFGCIRCLVIRAAFSASGKVEIVAINDPFIDLYCMVYMFGYHSGKFNSTVKAENGKIVIKRKPITIF
jgi:glyceraldehyde 3-phosphate dehydrogenase